MFCLKKPLEFPVRVDLRRTASRHALQIRPTDRSRPANRSPAPGAAYADADPELFAQGDAFKSFRELAAGSARQLAGPFCIPGEGDRTEDRSRLLRADDGRQSLRLLCRGLRHQFSVSIHQRSQDRARALSRHHGAGAAVCRVLEGDSARGRQHGRFPGRAECAIAEKDQLRHSDGAGHSDAGGDAGLRLRILPRLGVAVDPDLPAPRPRRALRLRLSHSIAPRHRPGRRSARGRKRFHRSARLGRSLSSGRRLDRVRRHLGHAGGRGAHPASPPRRTTGRLPRSLAVPASPMSNSASR